MWIERFVLDDSTGEKYFLETFFNLKLSAFQKEKHL